MEASRYKNQIMELKVKVEEIQSLMIAYVTDGREDSQPASYQALYAELDIGFEDLNLENPNPHKSLESFWGFCKLKKMGTWAERRTYVRELYGDILLDFERRLRRAKEPRHWKSANVHMTDELAPVRIQWLKAKNYIYRHPPDYENSIKESINSVESVLKIALDEPKSTLGKLIHKTDLDVDIKRLISQAYGLLSNKDSVRHGGVTNNDLTESEAEFFLEFAAISIIYLKRRLFNPKKVDPSED